MARNGTPSGGGKKGNMNASLHNVYYKHLLDRKEQKAFKLMYEEIVNAYSLESRPADLLLLSTALIDYIRAMRGYVYEYSNSSADISDALERAVRSMRNNLSEIGITGKNRQIDNATTSFSALLAQLAGGPNVP